MEGVAIGGNLLRLSRHAAVLGIAGVLAVLVTRQGTAVAGAPISLRNIDAVQIDAVIERPAVAPMVVSRPAQTVVVAAGQTVESLAQQYRADVAAVRWANDLAGDSEPAAGTPLLIPPAAGALVRVLQGETPTTFATRIGLDPGTLLNFNALQSDAPLPAGSYLQVPMSAAPVGALIADRFVVADSGVPAVAPNHGSDGFPYGQCTWYVASRRNVTWGGDAWTWWFAASGIRPEGQVPVQGAIAVFDGGWAGHVAYVEHVNPDGSYIISEMNFYDGHGGGWGRVDRRTIPANDPALLGFIY